MRPRGWLLVVLASVLVATLMPSSRAVATTSNATLTVSIPGELAGCYFNSAATSNSLRSILDLVRPSAFMTTPQGTLVGASGPIVQSELVSLNPQTVVYTIAPGWQWSNGLSFNGNDLLYWYQHARGVRSSLTDGYRDISSATVSANLDQVTVVFSSPFADWNTLFRDVNMRSTPTTCTLSELATQPSLGPYRLVSITHDGAILLRNHFWLGPKPRFAAVVVHTGVPSLRRGAAPIVDYRYSVSTSVLTSLSGDQSLSGHVGLSNQLVTLGFSPHSGWTNLLSVRQFLSLAINRQTLINQLVGAQTFNVGPADSSIFAQGQVGYPGTTGLTPYAQSALISSTTIPTMVSGDCVVCAAGILRAAGFVRVRGRWKAANGVPLAIRLAVGPSSLDRATAAMIVTMWNAFGIPVTKVPEGSDFAVASALRAGHADAGVLTVTTGVEPFSTARSWTGVPFADSFDLGWRSTQIDQWFSAAEDTFNPVDAKADYDDIDQYITTQSWERPLFTEPSLLMWSANIAGIYQSSTLDGLVDQIPTWGYLLSS